MGQRHRRPTLTMDQNWTSIGATSRVCWSVERPHCVLSIAGFEDIKTVAPLIESKDDLVTVDHLPGSLDTARPQE